MNNHVDDVQHSYSLMTDEQKLEILIIELNRNEGDMRFKPQDRFVFDEAVPWWISAFTKVHYAMIVIPLILFFILTVVFGIPSIFVKVCAGFGLIIVIFSDAAKSKKNKVDTKSVDESLSSFNTSRKQQLLYRASLLQNTIYTPSLFYRVFIRSALFSIFVGMFILSWFIP